MVKLFFLLGWVAVPHCYIPLISLYQEAEAAILMVHTFFCSFCIFYLFFVSFSLLAPQTSPGFGFGFAALQQLFFIFFSPKGMRIF